MKKSIRKEFKKSYTLEINDIEFFYKLLFKDSNEKISYSVGFGEELYKDFKDIKEVIGFIKGKGVKGLISIEMENGLTSFSADSSSGYSSGIRLDLYDRDEKEVNHIIKEFEEKLQQMKNCNFILVGDFDKFIIFPFLCILFSVFTFQFFVRNLGEVLAKYAPLLLIPLTILIFFGIFTSLIGKFFFKRIVFKDGNKKNSFIFGWGLILGFITVVGFVITILSVF